MKLSRINRLVRASFAPGGDTANAVVRAAYTYNGLHQRATRRAAADTALGLAASDAGNLYYYDSAWRLCEERAATHWDGSAAFTPAKITQRFWCPLYIDALIATQTDTTGADPDPGPGADGDFTDAIFENTLYAACDRKYDVIAMTDADGILKERTDYSPYGVARQRPPADLNGDGKIDGVDQLIFFNAWGAAIGAAAYNPDADINFDGQVTGSDFLILSNNFGADPAPPGAVSQHGNTVGYSGYIYDDAIGLSLARFRWYDAETGRWATRDPLLSVTESHYKSYRFYSNNVYDILNNHSHGNSSYSHIDWLLWQSIVTPLLGNAYQYVQGAPLDDTDSSGLSPEDFLKDIFGPDGPLFRKRVLPKYVQPGGKPLPAGWLNGRLPWLGRYLRVGMSWNANLGRAVPSVRIFATHYDLLGRPANVLVRTGQGALICGAAAGGYLIGDQIAEHTGIDEAIGDALFDLCPDCWDWVPKWIWN